MSHVIVVALGSAVLLTPSSFPLLLFHFRPFSLSLFLFFVSCPLTSQLSLSSSYARVKAVKPASCHLMAAQKWPVIAPSLQREVANPAHEKKKIHFV